MAQTRKHKRNTRLYAWIADVGSCSVCPQLSMRSRDNQRWGEHRVARVTAMPYFCLHFCCHKSVWHIAPRGNARKVTGEGLREVVTVNGGGSLCSTCRTCCSCSPKRVYFHSARHQRNRVSPLGVELPIPHARSPRAPQHCATRTDEREEGTHEDTSQTRMWEACEHDHARPRNHIHAQAVASIRSHSRS